MFRAIGLALGLLALIAGGAEAHARLIRAEPRVGATIAASPPALRLLFSESLQPAFTSVTLTRVGGEAVALGRLACDPADQRLAVVPIAARLPPGRYRVNWTATSVDRHQTEGDFTFTIGR